MTNETSKRFMFLVVVLLFLVDLRKATVIFKKGCVATKGAAFKSFRYKYSDYLILYQCILSMDELSCA